MTTSSETTPAEQVAPTGAPEARDARVATPAPDRGTSRLLRRLAPLLLLVLLAVLPLVDVTVPGVLPGSTYTAGTLQLLALCLLFAALALTYHVIFGVAGLLSFGHALYLAIGAYGLGIVLERTDLALVPAMLVTLVGGTLVAVVLGVIGLRVSGISFAMVTLAFAQAGSVLIRRNADVTGGEESLRLDTTHVPDALVGVADTRNLYWLTLALVVVVLALVTWFERSRAGHVAAATRENELRVRVLGLRPFVVKLIAFVIGSSLAVVVGMVYLLLQSGVTPRVASADFTLTILVVVVLGGLGSRWGAILGGVVYTLLDQRLTTLAASDTVAGLPAVLQVPLSEPLFLLGTLFILVVLFVPGGLVGVGQRLASARPRAARRRTADGAGA
ncbi:leucine/isoleucine/valine transporter permease subunit [Nocardioides dokdonensis FR1436]|uniref:Leucine/isoleucine/valine transporter permease subunit n=1 Tax=Nocardioides dokdonensis FR1436 TaxID=1300347 RepID=A0A1A9GK41_9ACTN|nr:branched-chain amino acid ABC transporter permease [Nocardioides dokdonensis]ANH38648.1 leucine/isoleucine/valine transporter permease subunit [Nocardioides dokdonensis FR1436]